MSGSIFDQSSNMYNSHKDESKKEDSKAQPTKIKKAPSKLVDPEISGMLSKMQEMQEDLEHKIREVREDAKKNGVDIDQYLNSNFKVPKNEVENLESQKKHLSDKIAKALPKESGLKKNPKSQESLTKERRSKFRGERHNWIPMS